MTTTDRQLQEAEGRRAEKSRYLDLCLILKRKTTGETLLEVGGRWDRLRKCYTDDKPQTCKVITLEESQVEFTRWFASWLAAFRDGSPRDTRLALTAGVRRGGKTTIGLICTVALAIEAPNAITWAVSSTYSERDELEQKIRQFIPSSWYTYRGAPRYRYTFPTGSVLRNLSGDDPETLKQGQCDLVFVNEGQKMASSVLTNAIPGVIDRGGLTLLAANPPRRVIGEWVRELKEAIDTGKLKSARFFGFDARLNTQIDQKARQDVGDILRVVDPKAAAADDEGLWLPVGDVAYPAFSAAQHGKPVPQDGESTSSITQRRLNRPYQYVAGADFQATPYHAGVFVKTFAGKDGKPTYWAVAEVLREGTEDDFLDSVDLREDFVPENTVWIGDASGEWQDGAHKTKGRVSFDIFRSRRWHIHPPQKKKTDTGQFAKNPAREDRMNLVNNLLTQGRLYVDPVKCPKLVVALKKCQIKHGKPYGQYAHVTDALGYALYWLEPKPSRAPSTDGPGAFTFDIFRRGSDVT